jgi:hypothetical protein
MKSRVTYYYNNDQYFSRLLFSNNNFNIPDDKKLKFINAFNNLKIPENPSDIIIKDLSLGDTESTFNFTDLNHTLQCKLCKCETKGGNLYNLTKMNHEKTCTYYDISIYPNRLCRIPVCTEYAVNNNTFCLHHIIERHKCTYCHPSLNIDGTVSFPNCKYC